MHIFFGNRHMIDQCLPRHAVIAEKIVFRNKPLVAKKQMHAIPGGLRLVFFRPESVKLGGRVPACQGDGKAAPLRHCVIQYAQNLSERCFAHLRDSRKNPALEKHRFILWPPFSRRVRQIRGASWRAAYWQMARGPANGNAYRARRKSPALERRAPRLRSRSSDLRPNRSRSLQSQPAWDSSK